MPKVQIVTLHAVEFTKKLGHIFWCPKKVTHICLVTSVDYKVRLGQVKSEFDWKRQKLTRSVRALKLSIFSQKSYSVDVFIIILFYFSPSIFISMRRLN